MSIAAGGRSECLYVVLTPRSNQRVQTCSMSISPTSVAEWERVRHMQQQDSRRAVRRTLAVSIPLSPRLPMRCATMSTSCPPSGSCSGGITSRRWQARPRSSDARLPSSRGGCPHLSGWWSAPSSSPASTTSVPLGQRAQPGAFDWRADRRFRHRGVGARSNGGCGSPPSAG